MDSLRWDGSPAAGLTELEVSSFHGFGLMTVPPQTVDAESRIALI